MNEYFIALNLIQFLAKLQYKQNLNHVMRIQNIYKSITVKEHLHDAKSKIKIIRYIQSEIEKEKEKKKHLVILRSSIMYFWS